MTTPVPGGPERENAPPPPPAAGAAGEIPAPAPTPATTAPATGSWEPLATELAPGEEPVVTGTLFLTMIMLMIIAGIWFIMYGRLLHR